MNHRFAADLAARIRKAIQPHVQRAEVAGSVRRWKAECRDIEIVALADLNHDLFGDGNGSPILDPLTDTLRTFGELALNGPRQKKVVLKGSGMKVDVFIVHPPAQWGVIYAIRTGPAALGTMCVGHLKKHRGHRCRNGRIVNLGTGKTVDTPRERDFFELCGFPFVDPARRHALAQAVERGFYQPAVGRAAPQPFTGL